MNIHQKAKSRIAKLRQRMLVQPAICLERAYYRTLSYQETEGDYPVMRRAKAFDKILQNITVEMTEGELIVGKMSSKPRGGSISPELQCDWILDELDLISTRDIDPFQPLTAKEKKLLREIVPYWQQRSLRNIWNQRIPEESRPYDDVLIGGGAFCGNNQYYGHISPDYALVLNLGVEGVIERIDRRIAALQPEKYEDFQQIIQLQAMRLCLNAIVGLAERYAALAEQLAQSETSPIWKEELCKIAQNCRNVPRKPAATFHEAIQCVWFLYMGMEIENWGTGNTFLRADQYLYPFYQRDIEAGRITRAEAYELIALLLIKCNEFCVVYSEHRSHGYAGNCSGTAFTLGGVKADGSCAVNDVSYLFLEAENDVNLSSEDMVIRVTHDMPEDFLLLACTVARDVSGKLKFVGDQTCIQQMLYDERPLEMARDYAIVGCTSPTVGGRSLDIPGGVISLPMILELALNNGVSTMTGRKLGCQTGDARNFSSYDELWAAFCRQVDTVIPHCHVIKNLDKAIYAEYSPSPFLSCMYECCIDKGQDILRGGTYPHLSFAMALAGAPNVGDSLAAIKKLVFDEQVMTMEQVLDALACNFEGMEEVQALLARAPKFGNNDPYVDTIVNDVLSYVSDTIAKTPGFAGARSTAAAAAITANVGLGMCLGASADGRKAGSPISEGGLSPYQGRNISGPTATLLSVAGIDHIKLRHGEVLNMRFDPKALESDANLRKFAALIKAFFAAGGFLVQFNIVNTATLRDAQVHPDRYRDLVVRVATYAAYFVEIGPELQNDIINRLEFSGL